MCRWAAYLGSELYLEDIICSPCHSLVAQSQDAFEAKTATNGDGFGVAWYGSRPEPGLYRDLLPAWSDQNLKSLAQQISSKLFLAHVRAATDGCTTRSNCHPFAYDRWSFMHNGQIGSFERLKRRLEHILPDELYEYKKGSTDSELIFLLMLHFGLASNPVLALRQTVMRIIEVAEQADVKPFLRLTAAFSDGEALYAVRYATDAYAPTLYTTKMTGASGICVVSEPLDNEKANWMAVPVNSFVTICSAQRIEIDQFMPETLPVAQALPIRTPAANTKAPPKTTWKVARQNGVSI